MMERYEQPESGSDGENLVGRLLVGGGALFGFHIPRLASLQYSSRSHQGSVPFFSFVLALVNCTL